MPSRKFRRNLGLASFAALAASRGDAVRLGMYPGGSQHPSRHQGGAPKATRPLDFEDIYQGFVKGSDIPEDVNNNPAWNFFLLNKLSELEHKHGNPATSSPALSTSYNVSPNRRDYPTHDPEKKRESPGSHGSRQQLSPKSSRGYRNPESPYRQRFSSPSRKTASDPQGKARLSPGKGRVQPPQATFKPYSSEDVKERDYYGPTNGPAYPRAYPIAHSTFSSTKVPEEQPDTYDLEKEKQEVLELWLSINAENYSTVKERLRSRLSNANILGRNKLAEFIDPLTTRMYGFREGLDFFAKYGSKSAGSSLLFDDEHQYEFAEFEMADAKRYLNDDIAALKKMNLPVPASFDQMRERIASTKLELREA